MGEIADFSHQHGIAVLSSHHATKKDGRYRDSTAIGANGDLIVEMHETKHGDKYERKFEVKGRFTVDSFTLRFTGDGYSRVGEPPSVYEQIEDCIRQNPGCSKATIRKRVHGANARIDEALADMIDSGEILDQGDEQHSRLHLPHETDDVN